MLQYQTVSPGTVVLLKKLMAMPELDSFFLVGGTSLALQAGHRISIDLDFFTDRHFDIADMQKSLSRKLEQFELLRVSQTGFTCIIQSIKCDFFNWSVPFIGQSVLENGIRLCSLEDIAAFKLDAIVSRKEKKDFWDIEILIRKLGFEKILQSYRQKYPYIDRKVALDALSEIDIADDSEEPQIILPISWDVVKKNIKEAWLHYLKQLMEKKELEKQQRLHKAEELLKNKKKDI
jgi:hypothetical protein